MKSDRLTTILTDLAENAFPSEDIDLWPAIKDSIRTSNWQLTRGASSVKKSSANRHLLRRTAVVVLLLFAAFGILLATPQGRAFAHKIFLFFSVTNEQSFVVPTDQTFVVPETSTPRPAYVLPLEPVQNVTQPEPTQPIDLSCNTPVSQAVYSCQVKAVETLAGFDVKEYPYDPKGTKFSKVTFNAEINQVTTEFVVSTGGGYLYLRQGINDFVPAEDDWSKVPSEAVEQVTVNGQYAEIAVGTYVVYPNAASAVWEPGGQLSLVWRDGDHWFVLEKLGDPYPIEWITKDELIMLAESLVDERPLDMVPPRNPENLKSIAEVEELAGFEVLVPTLLPQGYEFKRGIWAYNSVRLLYGPKSSSDSTLNIFMGPVEDYQVSPCSECPPGTDEVVQVGRWQGWYWRGIFFTESGIEGQPTPTPIWQADAQHWQLVWNTDTLWINMFFATSENGLEMNKEDLIAIAESLK